MRVRPLDDADVEPLAGVLARAYGSSQDFALRLRSYRDARRVATFVAEVDGAPAGFVAAHDYGTIAYVALMGVDPAHQRRGAASALMSALTGWIDAGAFAAAELDATAPGAPLYERFGFGDAGETRVCAGDAAGGAARAGDHVRPFAPVLTGALAACDAAAFGADRAEALERLIAHPENRAFVVGDAGAVAGYAVAQPAAGLIGPVVAADAAQAGALVDAARSVLRGPHRMSVPAPHPGAAHVARDRGYTFARTLRHMQRGARPAAARERIFARMNLGQG